MRKMKTHPINDAVTLNIHTDSRFTTIRMSVNLLVPLTEKTASIYGILPRIVTRATTEYPDYSALTKKLADLYGATLDCNVQKLGGYQVISFIAEGISSRYAFEKEDMFQELSALLLSVITKPLRDSNGLFPREGFLQEKRQILELFESEFNDKVSYAYKRAEEILFAGLPAGINRYGTKENVEKLSLSEVSEAWDILLQSARFEIFVLGDCKPNPDVFKKIFGSLGTIHTYQLPKFSQGQLKDVKEEIQSVQSKLVMGFTVNDHCSLKQDAFKLMSAVYGGTASSKLFLKVREKLSLCYYCSSSFDANTATLFVQSGVETQNLAKARAAILEQLDEIKKAAISVEEIQAAKLAMRHSYYSVQDSLSATEYWYLTQVFRDEVKTPEEAIESIENLTKDEVAAAANQLILNTVYTLKGNE